MNRLLHLAGPMRAWVSPRVAARPLFLVAFVVPFVGACATGPEAGERVAVARPEPNQARAGADFARAGTDFARADARERLVLAMAEDWTAALDETSALSRQGASDGSRAGFAALLRDGMASALSIAVESDGGAGAADLLVLSSLQCWSLRANPAGLGVARADAERALPRLERAREDLWSRASREFDAKSLAELRLLIDAWVKANPDETRVTRVRLADLASERGGLAARERERAAAILATTGAAGRVDADARARLFGARVLWYVSRYPSLLGAHAESSAARIAQSGERESRDARAALADTLAKERAVFGEILASERKALAAAATTERKAIAGSLGEERAALADALAKERAALATALGKEREAAAADLAREREALVAGVNKAVDASSAAAKAEREALAKWAGGERAAFAEDLEARLVKVVDRAIMGAGIVVGVLLVGLAALKFIPSRKAG